MKPIIILVASILFVNVAAFAQWQRADGPTGGDVRALEVDPLTHYVYAGLNSGGLYKSTDDGQTWTFVHESLRGVGINAIALRGENILVGTLDKGVLRSTDGGSTWGPANSGIDASNRQVLAFAVSNDKIFAGTETGVYLSQDNGASWSVVNNGIDPNTLYARALGIADNKLYVGVLGSGINGGIYTSTDNGSNWSAANTGLSDNSLSVADFDFDGEYVYAATNGGVFKAPKAAGAWTMLTGHTTMTIAVVDRMIYVGTVFNGLHISTDHGSTWTGAGADFAFDNVSAIAVSGDNVFAGAWDGGVSVSSDAGSTWTTSNNGMYGVSVLALAAREDSLYAAAFPGVYSLSGTDWGMMHKTSITSYAQSMAVRGTILFLGTQADGVFLTRNNGFSWEHKDMNIPYVQVIALAVRGDSILAGTNHGFVVSTDDGETWVTKSNGLGDAMVLSIALREGDIFLGTTQGAFKSTDGGANWSIMNGLPPGWYGAVGVKGQTIIAGGIFAVYVSPDNGATWNNFIETGPFNANTIYVNGSQILLGTNDGVFLSTDGGNTFGTMNTGLLDKQILSLTIHDDYIHAGTLGGSVWKRPVSDIVTAIGDNNHVSFEKGKIEVYPNPVKQELLISGARNDAAAAIYDMIGNLIQAQPLDNGSVDVSTLPNGVYVIKVQSSDSKHGRSFVKKFVKE